MMLILTLACFAVPSPASGEEPAAPTVASPPGVPDPATSRPAHPTARPGADNPALQAALAPTLAHLDRNADGKVDAAEYNAVLWKGPGFEEADGDGNGVLGLEELCALFLEQDPSTFDPAMEEAVQGAPPVAPGSLAAARPGGAGGGGRLDPDSPAAKPGGAPVAAAGEVPGGQPGWGPGTPAFTGANPQAEPPPDRRPQGGGVPVERDRQMPARGGPANSQWGGPPGAAGAGASPPAGGPGSSGAAGPGGSEADGPEAGARLLAEAAMWLVAEVQAQDPGVRVPEMRQLRGATRTGRLDSPQTQKLMHEIRDLWAAAGLEFPEELLRE